MRLLAYLGRENPRAGCGPRAEAAESAKRARPAGAYVVENAF